MKWFEFSQINSGGSFDVDDKVCRTLYIEAESFGAAIAKAEELGCYWYGVDKGIDCSHCGDRWSKWNDDPIDIELYKTKGYKSSNYGTLYFNNIEEYAQFFADKFGMTVPEGRIYYHDGNVKEIFSAKLKH